MLKRALIRIRLILEFKLRYFRRRLTPGARRATVLFYPEVPYARAVMYKICHTLGYSMTRRVNSKANVVVNWEDVTNRRAYESLTRLSAQHTVINLRCTDISKRHVDRVHARVFGYSTEIDPLTHRGPCVKKSDVNAVHDGTIIQCPITQREERCIYQKVIDNIGRDGNAHDIRVPVFGSRIPFCYLKSRPRAQRFGNENLAVALHNTAELLTDEEVGMLLRFSADIGLDYGELDVLRDHGDQRIYVVDVNPTPDGPPNHIGAADSEIALARMADAFNEVFLGVLADAP
jgi:hypothetical protein